MGLLPILREGAKVMGNIKDKFNNMVKGIESIWDDIYSLGFSNGYEMGVLDGEVIGNVYETPELIKD
jgi:hypothetical protein